MIEGVWLEVLEDRGIVVVGVGTFAKEQKCKYQFDLRVLKRLMGLCQECKAELFEVDEIEDVDQEVFKFRIKCVQVRYLMEKVVVMLQQFGCLKHFRDLALLIPFVGEVFRVNGHVNIFSLLNRFLQGITEGIALFKTHIEEVCRALKALLDISDVGIREVEVERRHVILYDKIAYFVCQMRFTRTLFRQDERVAVKRTLRELQCADAAFKFSYFLSHSL